MDYNIIATLGPTSDEPSLWHSMLDEGVNGFRLNTSHVSTEELKTWLKRFNAFHNGLNEPSRLVLDLQGSKWRLGNIIEGELVKGERVILKLGDTSGQRGTLPIPHADFFKAAHVSSNEIYLNDAKVHLLVESVDEEIIKAQVLRGGLLSSGKGITFANSKFRQETLSSKDKEIIEQTKAMPYLQYAISYVKDEVEFKNLRSYFPQNSHIIAKIERSSSVDRVSQIAEVADEIWVCRGDLGAELGLAGMAKAVYKISNQVSNFPIPVYMAGQVLEHMTTLPVPTRSEICFIHDSLMAGCSGFVLSDETAIGHFPIISCRTAALLRSV